jgi:hypothetical protein
MARRLLPSTGSLGSVPPFPGTIRRSDSLPPVPPRFVAFAWRCHGRARISLPRPSGAPATGLELVTRSLRPGFTVEATGPPRFLGNPCERVLLSDPGGITDARPLRRRDAAFRPFNNVGSRNLNISGLNDTTRALAVYASQPGSPRDHARLASGCWPALPDGVGYPQGSNERFPRAFASSFPKLTWRT